MSLTVRNKAQIINRLDEIFELSISDYEIKMDKELIDIIGSFSKKSQNATSALTNIITCLICNATDNAIDPRYHRKPSNEMPEPSSGKEFWFSGRTISEKIIYPWLSDKGYRTAKSGWQTRTFERPRPYMLDYPENIAFVKEEFLHILGVAAKGSTSSTDILIQLFRLEETIKKNRKKVQQLVAKNKIGNEVLISDLINLFKKHFSLPNSSILPVYAIYATYQSILNEVKQYKHLRLKPLDAHEASDKRTGAIGDIELIDSDNDVVEAIEIKHGLTIDLPIVLRAEEKIKNSQVKRYYILTTHKNCNTQSKDIQNIIESVYKNHGCQIIINGVLPTIKYYLRLISRPNEVINFYSHLISSEKSIKYDQIQNWSDLFEEMKITYGKI